MSNVLLRYSKSSLESKAGKLDDSKPSKSHDAILDVLLELQLQAKCSLDQSSTNICSSSEAGKFRVCLSVWTLVKLVVFMCTCGFHVHWLQTAVS